MNIEDYNYVMQDYPGNFNEIKELIEDFEMLKRIDSYLNVNWWPKEIEIQNKIKELEILPQRMHKIRSILKGNIDTQHYST